MRRPPVGLWLALFAVACGGSRSTGAVLVDQETGQDDPFFRIEQAEDRQRFGPDLEALASRADGALRLRVAEAIGRIGDPRGAETLGRLLSDPEPRVRDAAAFAAGLIGPAGGDRLNAALSDALDREKRPDGLRALAWAAAKTGDRRSLEGIAPLLDHPDPRVCAGGMQGIGLLETRGVEVPEALQRKIAAGLQHSAEEVRLMAAFALGQASAKARDLAGAIPSLRIAAAGDGSAEVRIQALRALGAWRGIDGDAIERALEDPDYRVGAEALRALLAADGPLRCPLAERGLERLATALDADPAMLQGSGAQKLIAGLESASACPGRAAIAEQAGRIADRIRRLPRSANAATGRILCLARLVRGSDEIALLGCDPARPGNGKEMVLRRIRSRGAATDRDLEVVKGIAAEDDTAASAEAIRTLGRIDREEAAISLLERLGDPRAIAVTAALESIAGHPDRFRARAGTADLRTRLLAEVEKVVDRFLPFGHAHAPLIASARALGAIADPAAGPILRKLAPDTRPAVRRALLEAFLAIDGLPPLAGLPPTEAFGPASGVERVRLQLSRATALIKSSRGEIAVALNSAGATAAAQSFAALARAGYFSGTPVFRAVPGTRVEAGDPTGTGLGDPGYGLPGAPGPEPVQRGTIAMARAFTDSEGGLFFVALSREPALDGRYTVLGQVVSGIETLDLLVQGDLVEEVSVAGD